MAADRHSDVTPDDRASPAGAGPDATGREDATGGQTQGDGPAVRMIETHEGISLAAPEAEGPPIRDVGLVEWLRENLFSDRKNTALTLLFAAVLVVIAIKALGFVFVTGRWSVVEVNLTNFMVGRFPRGELWRLVTVMFVLTAAVSVSLGRVARSLADAAVEPPRRNWMRTWQRTWPFLVLAAGILALTRTPTPTLLTLAAAALGVAGFYAGNRVPHRLARWVHLGAAATTLAMFFLLLFAPGYGWGVWGGLLMNVFAAAVGIIVSFPIGVALALGRRSQLPGIKAVCVAYIELIRGVPLITLLLMAFFVVGFVFPPGVRPPGLIARALIVLVAFTAAYVAEIVRGGLQSVPKGQIEAAQAVGLSPWKITRLIVLPQALRNVIPALVGQFISLFKDTSLLYIIGVLESLRVAQVVLQQQQFRAQGLQAETHVFAAFLFWVFAYAMSKESQRLEQRLGLGER